MRLPKYLFNASLMPEGAAGLLKQGGTARREVVKRAVEGLGGTLDAFYFAFGDTDVIGIVDLPDAAAATAFSLTVSSSGTVGVRTTVLITPEEVDQARGRKVDWTPPGS
jgi:uncharacterized protein with GYD domain